MKILILNYTGYRSNWGCQATSRGLLQLISTAFSKAGDCEIDIIPFPPTHWRDIWQSRRHGDFLEKYYQRQEASPEALEMFESLCRGRFSDYLQRVRDADIVFFQGEGSIGPGRMYRETRLFGLPLLAKQHFGKTVVSINQTISFASNYQAELLQQIYNEFDLNFVREEQSLKLCSGPDWPKFDLIPDAAFAYSPQAEAQRDRPSRRYFCISGSAEIGAYDLESYAKNIAAIARRWDLLPVFVYSRSSDAVMVNAFEKAVGAECDVVSSKTHPDVDQLIGVLSGAEAVIGGRYHTSISALSVNVPVVLTRSNSHKSDGLSKMFDGDVRLIDHASGTQMLEAMETAMRDRNALRARLQQTVSRLTQQASAAVDDLRKKLSLPSGNRQFTCVQPNFNLKNRWRAMASIKSMNRTVNLGVFDRSNMTRAKSESKSPA